MIEPSIRYTGSSLEFEVLNGAGERVGNVILEPSGDCATASRVNIDSIRAGGTAQKGTADSLKF